MRVDLDLIGRLDSSTASVEHRAVISFRRTDGDPARSQPFGNGALVAQGRGRFVNRAIGISLDEGVTDRLDELEEFFAVAGVPAAIEVSSWAPALAANLAARGYHPDWFVEVFVTPAAEAAQRATSHGPARVVSVTTELLRTWQDVFVAAFGYDSADQRAQIDAHTEAMFGTGGTHHFVAFLGDRPAGCGSLLVDGDVAWVGGAATVPGARGQGVQSALLSHRIALAVENGCELIAATAVPSGGSARNLRRLAFTSAHTRLVMSRAP